MANEATFAADLNAEMQTVMRLVSLGHAARNAEQIKVRQPLAEALFSVPGDQAGTVKAYADLIADELNVKAVTVLDEPGDVVTYELNPLPDVLGKRFKGDFPKIQKLLREHESDDYALALLRGQPFTVAFNGVEETLTPEEVEVRMSPAEGYAVARENQTIAALDTRLTDDLLAEGLAREFIRRVQTLRRDADFNVEDHIRLEYAASDKLAKASEQFGELIAGETLADEMEPVSGPTGEVSESYEFDGETLTVALSRLR
jgi:isoleucyl-tRNA synthetase